MRCITTWPGIYASERHPLLFAPVYRRGLSCRPTFMRPDDVRNLALMLPDVREGAHRGNPDFRFGERIFATLWVEEERVVLRLTPAEQARVLDDTPELFDPIPGAWGRRGWTNLDLWDADEATLRDALFSAWRTVASAALDGD